MYHCLRKVVWNSKILSVKTWHLNEEVEMMSSTWAICGKQLRKLIVIHEKRG